MPPYSSLLERFEAPGPKRILALDGGGIRGALTLGFLKKIETELLSRHKHLYKNENDFRLCHYFDLIGGTSTGAIIASALAIGMTVDEIMGSYQDLGGEIFRRKYSWKFWKRWWVDYTHKPLEKELKKAFSKNGQPIMFNDQETIQTGLCIVIQRADTVSMWPLANNPRAKYYKCNNYPLWELVRCSSAAPTYFRPHIMPVLDADGRSAGHGVFVDGALSMMNNPALQLFLTATFEAFKFNWKVGTDQLLIVSIGTGYQKRNDNILKITRRSKLGWAKNIPEMYMEGSTWQNQLFMQWFGESKNSFIINQEVGNLADEKLMQDKKFFTYVRYNTKLDAKDLEQELGLSYTEKEVENLRKIDMGKNRFELAKIGRAAAEKYFKPEHLPDVFDLASTTVHS